MFNQLINQAGAQEVPDATQVAADYQGLKPTMREAVRSQILAMRQDPTFNFKNIATRFSDIVNLGWTKDKSVVIVGAGNLGHPVFRTVLDLGFEVIHVIDDDVIDVENVSPQGHDIVELGQPKVEVLKDWALRHCGTMVHTHQVRLQDWDHLVELTGFVPDILITGVDNMVVRNAINGYFLDRRQVSEVPELLIDMRMSAGEWTTYILPVRAAVRHGLHQMIYQHLQDDMIFDDSEGETEPCTARATNFTGNNAASYVGSFLTWYSRIPVFTADFVRAFFNRMNTETPFKYERTFDAMRFRYVTKPPEDVQRDNEFMSLRNASFGQANTIDILTDALAKMSGTDLNDYIDPHTVVVTRDGLYHAIIYGRDTWSTYTYTPCTPVSATAIEHVNYYKSDVLAFIPPDRLGIDVDSSENPLVVRHVAGDRIGDYMQLQDSSIYEINYRFLDNNTWLFEHLLRSEYVLKPVMDIAAIIRRDRIDPEYFLDKHRKGLPLPPEAILYEKNEAPARGVDFYRYFDRTRTTLFERIEDVAEGYDVMWAPDGAEAKCKITYSGEHTSVYNFTWGSTDPAEIAAQAQDIIAEIDCVGAHGGLDEAEGSLRDGMGVVPLDAPAEEVNRIREDALEQAREHLNQLAERSMERYIEDGEDDVAPDAIPGMVPLDAIAGDGMLMQYRMQRALETSMRGRLNSPWTPVTQREWEEGNVDPVPVVSISPVWTPSELMQRLTQQPILGECESEQPNDQAGEYVAPHGRFRYTPVPGLRMPPLDIVGPLDILGESAFGAAMPQVDTPPINTNPEDEEPPQI